MYDYNSHHLLAIDRSVFRLQMTIICARRDYSLATGPFSYVRRLPMAPLALSVCRHPKRTAMCVVHSMTNLGYYQPEECAGFAKGRECFVGSVA